MIVAVVFYCGVEFQSFTFNLLETSKGKAKGAFVYIHQKNSYELWTLNFSISTF